MEPDKRPISWLKSLLEGKNVADELSDEQLNEIGFDVTKTFAVDDASRSEWKERSAGAMKLAKQVVEEKSDPWPGAANVKYPLLTVAAFEFAAMAYPEICKGDEVVKCNVTGPDPDGQKAQKGERIAAHMNWQLTKQMKEWEDETDTMLHILPVTGCCFRKSYYDTQLDGGRNVSELVLPDDLVVNNKARKLEKARRVTHRYWMYENEIQEKFRSEVWKEQDIGQAVAQDDMEDRDRPHEILEQHRWWDLDGDGYQEPWIVTVHKLTSKVLRIDPRFGEDSIKEKNGKITKIEPDYYITLYKFLPNPDGSFYPVGFGQLMEGIGEAANTCINQLLDAGTLKNLGGGFMTKGLKIRGGKIERKPGLYIPVDASGGVLRDNIVPFPDSEPSAVLFQLLGMLVTAGKEISSIKDIHGEGLTANTPAHTALAIMERGLKVYAAIFKRIHRAMGDEFEKLYCLNGKYLDDEGTFPMRGQVATAPSIMPGVSPQGVQNAPLGGGNLPPGMLGLPPQMGQQQVPISRADYSMDDLDVVPVADPSLSTDIQRALKTQALLQLSGRPGMNELELTKRAIHSVHPQEEDKLFQPPQPGPPPPEVVLAMAQAEAAKATVQEKGIRLQMDMGKFQLELEELRAKIGKLKADSIKSLATAEDTQRGDLIEVYKAEMDNINKEIDRRINFAKEAMAAYGSANQQGAVGGMAAKPSDAGGVPGAPRG